MEEGWAAASEVGAADKAGRQAGLEAAGSDASGRMAGRRRGGGEEGGGVEGWLGCPLRRVAFGSARLWRGSAGVAGATGGGERRRVYLAVRRVDTEVP